MQTQTLPDAHVRLWLAAVLRASVGSLPPVPEEVTPVQVLALADREGVAGLVHQRLCQQSDWPELRMIFADAARRQAMQSLWLHNETTRLMRALHVAGLQTLVLKGVALSAWLYSAPHLRTSGDLDLLFASREDALRATEILAENGYGDGYAQGRHAYELVKKPIPGTAYALELDVHWRLLNTPVFADALDFQTLWQASIAIPALGEHARGLCPVHALCHAAMNRVVNLYTNVGDLLKCLYDIHLLVAHLDDARWAQLLRLSKDRGLCGVVHSALQAAHRDLGTQVPAEVLESLVQAIPHERLDPARLGDWGYMQRRSAAALPLGARLRWLRGRLIPDIDYLRSQYGAHASWPVLLMGQGRRLMGRLISGRGQHMGSTVSPWAVAALVAGIALLLVALLLPGSILSSWFYTDAHAPGRVLIWLEKTAFPFSRWFHAAMFVWLTIFMAKIFPQWRWWIVFALLALAVAGELIQFPVPGRTPGIMDVLDDLVGIGIGLVLLKVMRTTSRR